MTSPLRLLYAYLKVGVKGGCATVEVQSGLTGTTHARTHFKKPSSKHILTWVFDNLGMGKRDEEMRRKKKRSKKKIMVDKKNPK